MLHKVKPPHMCISGTAKGASNNYLQRDSTKNENFLPFKERCSVASKRRIKITAPKNATLLFSTFDKPVSNYINNVGGNCIFLYSRNIDAYNLEFCRDRELWICHLADEANALELRLAYALLRHGATKVRILCFPLGGRHDG